MALDKADLIGLDLQELRGRLHAAAERGNVDDLEAISRELERALGLFVTMQARAADKVIDLRCTQCGLPFARLQNGAIVIQSKHHGEKHTNSVSFEWLRDQLNCADNCALLLEMSYGEDL